MPDRLESARARTAAPDATSAEDRALVARRLRLLPAAIAGGVFGSAVAVGAVALRQGGGRGAAFVGVVLAAAVLAALVTLVLDRWLVRHLRTTVAGARAPGAGAPGAGASGPSARAPGADVERAPAEGGGVPLKDPLTGLLNGAAFEERLGVELRRAQREGYRVAVVALGLDSFRRINEGWGRVAGDEALRLVAERVATELRPSDLSGRIGGDEFMLGLVKTGGHDADEVVRRVRAAVAAVAFTPTGATMTASAGFALFPYDAADGPTLMRLADTALRRSKLSGRDRATAYADYRDAEGGSPRLTGGR